MKKFRAILAVVLVVVMVLAVCSGCGKKAESIADEAVPEAAATQNDIASVITSAKATKGQNVANAVSSTVNKAAAAASSQQAPAQQQSSAQQQTPAQQGQQQAQQYIQTGNQYADQTLVATNNTVNNAINGSNNALQNSINAASQGDFAGAQQAWKDFGNGMSSQTKGDYNYGQNQQAEAIINGIVGSFQGK